MGTPINDRVRKHRASLRLEGLRPVQLWVPDTRSPSFAVECQRQSEMLKADRQEREILDWMKVASDTSGWK